MASPAKVQQALATKKRPRSRKSISHMPSPDTIAEARNKENMTADFASTMAGKKEKSSEPPTKKLRSKSIGPGGLDALKEDSGNRGKVPAVPVIRSILKPTVAISPLRPIPARRTPAKNESVRRGNFDASSNNGLLIDISVPENSPPDAGAPILGVNTLSNPFDVGNVPSVDTLISLKTEEEQQAAAKERDEQERLEMEKNDLAERRKARRKSLANRRVSFAPEATLHVWDVVEYVQDSTTSSASTNSTRRASSLSGAPQSHTFPQSQSPGQNSDPHEPPSTPPEQVEEVGQESSPAHQRDLHQKKRRRRSSGIPPLNFNNPDDADDLSSSPYSGSSTAASEDAMVQAPFVEQDSSSSDADSDQGGNTMMSIDADENTSQSIISIVSRTSSNGSAGRLEEALRQAARQAGTQGIEYDEYGDLTMEMADDDVTAAFQPWAHKGVGPIQRLQVVQENTNPFSPAFRAGTARNSPEPGDGGIEADEDMSMDFTRAVGGILPPSNNPSTPTNVSPLLEEDSMGGDETMDLTTAIGGIQKQSQLQEEENQPNDDDDNEDLTMELTAVVGGMRGESPIKHVEASPSTLRPGTAKGILQVDHTSILDHRTEPQPATPKSRTALIKEGLLVTPKGALKTAALKNLTPKRATPKHMKGVVTPDKISRSKESTPRNQDRAIKSTPRKLQERQGSPVKRVKLHAPPSKTETTGRMTRAMRRNLAETTGNVQPTTPVSKASPRRKDNVTTPRPAALLENADSALPNSGVKSQVKTLEDVDVSTSVVEEEEEKIHLQDFLDMTSIRFMELTTTKRRHTIAPVGMGEGNPIDHGGINSMSEADGQASEPGQDLANCVVAGACTAPMLDLYQHSCHELKNYISEGRIIARDIEADTFEDNPPLFRDYISAPPDVKVIMDNQFKNMKTHARLLSKAMWYEWRMKLLEGVSEGLIRVAEGMQIDDLLLKEQEQLIASVLPRMIEDHTRLTAENEKLQAQADELASCDQEELLGARQKLIHLDEEIEAKKITARQLQDQLSEKEEGIEAVNERKKECAQEINEAERLREECRGWSANEVGDLKANVDALKSKYGWGIAAASGSTLTMIYRDQLQLFFDVRSFASNSSAKAEKNDNSQISLTYIADSHDSHPQPLSTEKRFFLQNMRVHLQCMRQGGMRVKSLLKFVSDSWSKACAVSENIRLLNVSSMTNATIVADEVLITRSTVLLPNMKTKIDICFEISISQSTTVLSVSVSPRAKVIYGERFNEQKMQEFLAGHVNEHIEGNDEKACGVWAQAVEALRGKLLSKAKKS